MATNDNYCTPSFTQVKEVFTFSEAIEYMKRLDKQPTTHTVNWYNVKTGERVAIGYT